VIFDGFNSLSFLDEVNSLDLRDSFRGFTFFQKNRSNYIDTFASVPSSLQGKLYSGGSFDEYTKGWTAFYEILRQSGFDLNIHHDYLTKFPEIRADVFTTGELINNAYSGNSKTVLALWQLLDWIEIRFPDRMAKLLRALVSSAFEFTSFKLKADFSTYPDIPLTMLFKSNNVLDVPKFLYHLSNETAKGRHNNYHYLHLMLPHSPYSWDENLICGKSDYVGQVRCAIRLMTELIKSLKESNRFDDSMVIFSSDHGWSRQVGPYPGISNLSPSTLEKIRESMNCDPNRFLHRTRSLLLIKPPNRNTNSMEISDALTQSIDIPATFADILPIKIPKNEGQSVFKIDPSTRREIKIYSGTHRYNRFRIKDDFGKNYKKGTLFEFTLDSDENLEFVSKIPVHWN